MPRSNILAQLMTLSFTLLIGCHDVDASAVAEAPRALPQTRDPAALMHIGAAGADASARPTAPTIATVGAAGAPAIVPSAADKSPGKVQLLCGADGAPGQLPAGYTLVAADLENSWTVEDGTLTWVDSSNDQSWTLWRKPRSGDALNSPIAGMTSGPNLVSNADTLAADGGDVFLRVSQLVGQATRVVLRRVPGDALAAAAGRGQGTLAIDHDAVYWLAAEDEQITLYRTPRTAAETVALGNIPFSLARGAQARAHVAGVVALGDYLYVALSSAGRAQLYRAAKGGAELLAPFGAELAAVAGLTTDGTDLVLILDPELDELGNVRDPARIARMTEHGELNEIAAVVTLGLSYHAMDVAISGGLLYWVENQHQDWLGTLWSAPLDGSRPPEKELTTPENLLASSLVAEEGAVYFGIYCRLEKGAQISGRTHVIGLHQ